MTTGHSAEFVGSIPEQYDQGMGPVMFLDFATDMASRVAALRPQRVLETAAGTGIVTRLLRDKLPASSHLTATDLNPPMLEVAQAKFKPGELVILQQADAMALPFADSSFDAVICQFGVMFFPDKDKAYREVNRVLAPDGRYFFSVWDAHCYNPFARIAHEVIGSFFPADPPPFYSLPYGYCSIDPIKETLLSVGFTDITIAVLSHRRKIADTAAFARAMVFGNPVIEQIRSRGGVDPERIVEVLNETFRRELGPEPCHTPMQTITFEARKP